MEMGGGWLIEVDIRDYFGSIDHQHLREALGQRIGDGVVLRLIGKWLNAGVMEDGQLSYPESGTPQGGVISPILANVYLHVVLDTSKDDDGTSDGMEQAVFELLGFKLFWARSQRGYWAIKLETSASRFTRTLHRLSEWCRKNRHRPVAEQWERLGQKLVGHFNYFGVVGNRGRLMAVRHELYGIWRNWLNRRSQRARMTWKKMRLLHQRYKLPLPPPLSELRSLRS